MKDNIPYCKVGVKNKEIFVLLPITKPTSKVRILRNDTPIRVRQAELCETDIIEWQISYFNENKELIELGKMIKLAYENGLIKKEQIEDILERIKSQKEFFDERYSIEISISDTFENFYGFKILKKTIPILVKEIEEILIWIELRHKQKAVGFQPMLFLRIPIKFANPSLTGKIAQPNQIVEWKPSLNIILETLKAFSIASQKHRDDMVEILNRAIK